MAKAKNSRWIFPFVVILLAVVVSVVSKPLLDNDGTTTGMVNMLTWLIVVVLLLVWWLLFSRVKWQTRLLGIVGVVLLLVGFSALFRFEGMTGNFTPMFSSKFKAAKEERAIEYFADAESVQVDSSKQLSISVGDWPNFGGPNRDHIVRGQTLRTDWEASPPEALWRHPVGAGWSSFSVVGDYLYTQEQRGENECVVCYQAKTGVQLWVHQDQERFEEAAGGPGPRATPTFHDSKLYAVGATGVLNCLDPVSGKLLWSTNIVKDNGGSLIEWAVAGSPVIHKNLVLVNPGTDAAFLAAYDRLTGKRVWQGPKVQAGYATPVVAELDGVTQVVMYRAEGVGGYSTETGQELWFFAWSNMPKITVAQPILLPDKSLFVSSGYSGGSVLLDIKKVDGRWQVSSRWERRNKFKLKFNGGIYKDGFVYGLDEQILSCFDVKEGKRTWKKGRYGYGQILMLEDQQLLVLTETGDVVLLTVTPESATEVARFSAIEGKTWNHPVLHNGLLYVRNDTEAACYVLK